MKKLIFIFTTLLLVSCGETSTDTKETSETKSTLTSDSDHTDAMIDYSDPAYMAGSSFGEFFQMLYKQEEFETMMHFTSDESIERHGKSSILDYYKSVEFGYDLDFKKIANSDSLTTLFYLGDIRATSIKVTMDVVVENDSCKLYIGDNIENAIKVNKDL